MKTDLQEVLRYLGYRDQSAGEDVLRLIYECEDEMQSVARPRNVWRCFDISIEGGIVRIGPINAKSEDLAAHLVGCNEAILFAATLGAGVDYAMLRAQGGRNISRAAVMQAVCAAMIEQYCDECGMEMAASAGARGLYLRPRYSPGYGDFSISYQREVLDILKGDKIGLSLTEGMMLVPTKSVTAVIGLSSQESGCVMGGCMNCKASDCIFRKG